MFSTIKMTFLFLFFMSIDISANLFRRNMSTIMINKSKKKAYEALI